MMTPRTCGVKNRARLVEHRTSKCTQRSAQPPAQSSHRFAGRCEYAPVQRCRAPAARVVPARRRSRGCRPTRSGIGRGCRGAHSDRATGDCPGVGGLAPPGTHPRARHEPPWGELAWRRLAITFGTPWRRNRPAAGMSPPTGPLGLIDTLFRRPRAVICLRMSIQIERGASMLDPQSGCERTK